MDTAQLKAWRSEVIERSINIESLLAAIICQHYFRKMRQDFLLEVMYDEHFHFGFKVRIFDKIVDETGKRLVTNLHTLGQIRNRFAHCGEAWLDPGSTEAYAPNPRNPETPIDFNLEFCNFNSVAEVTEKELWEVYLAKGGRFSNKLEGLFFETADGWKDKK